jgi:hypothetical protein
MEVGYVGYVGSKFRPQNSEVAVGAVGAGSLGPGAAQAIRSILVENMPKDMENQHENLGFVGKKQ